MHHDVLIRLIIATTCFFLAYILFDEWRTAPQKGTHRRGSAGGAIVILIILGLLILVPTFRMR